MRLFLYTWRNGTFYMTTMTDTGIASSALRLEEADQRAGLRGTRQELSALAAMGLREASFTRNREVWLHRCILQQDSISGKPCPAHILQHVCGMLNDALGWFVTLAGVIQTGQSQIDPAPIL